MKKIIILILIIFVSIILVLTLKNGITVGNFKIKGWNFVKELNENTNSTIQEAKKITSQDYENKVKELKTLIDKYNKTKNNYRSQMVYSEDGTIAGITIKKYKIERLWTSLGRYATDNNVDLSFDVSETNPTANINLYNLSFTIIGTYANTTSFLLDIIKDDSLNFDISNFNMKPNTIEEADDAKNQNKTTNTEKKVKADYYNLMTTFNVPNVGIEFD